MKRLLVAALLAFSLPAYAQTTIVIPTTMQIAWDHATPAAVDRFELKVDSAAYAAVGKTACPAPNASSFCAAVPALTQGAHTFVIRACNVGGCSADSAPPFPVVAVVVPGAATNVRLVP